MIHQWVADLVEQYGGPAAAEAQRIPWKAQEWAPFTDDRLYPKGCVAAVAELTELVDSAGVSRQHVRAVGEDCGPIGLFTAAMIWGLRPGGYGPFRLREMLTTPRHGRQPAEVITEIVNTVREKGAEAGFSSLWSAGASRVFRLGTAFGTKALYFAANDSTPGARPLVLDQFVYLGAQEFTNCDPDFVEAVPDPRRYMTGDMYLGYCTAMAARANGAGVRADMLEYALFAHGKAQTKADTASS